MTAAARACALLRSHGFVLVAAGLLLAVAALSAHAAKPSSDPGEQIYRRGILPTALPLTGSRGSGANVSGIAAACVNCHRRSGLGSVEGELAIPPVIAKYLYRNRTTNAEDLTLPHVPGWTAHEWTYSDVSLAQAIRTGVRPDGKAMSPLMPHYSLDDASMAVLIGYLKTLTSQPMPGVTDSTLHFATIVTPDADPVQKRAMLDVLQRFFATQQNVIAGDARPLHASREIMYRVTRRWQLHVWELTGAPQGWEQQLEQHLRIEPVFAVISGIGRQEWRPIHRFCERNAVPCLLPNIDLPVVAEGDFYSVYYSRGVLLESDLMATQLALADALPPKRLLQIYRTGDIGESAAAALEARAQEMGINVVRRPLPAGRLGAKDLRQAMLGAGKQDVLALWLRPSDLALLPAEPSGAVVLVSGLMAGLEQAPLPAHWRTDSLITYPFDTPSLRRVRMNFPLGWFKVEGIAVIDERIQTDTYLSCVILAETLGHMLDSFVPDFLLERMEMMLSRRLVNGYYPRLGLGSGQRFASKGGYLVHLSPDGGDPVAPGSDWITP